MKRLSAQDDANTATTNANITSGSVTGITDITVADGGTGRSTSTTAYGLIAAGTTATGAHQTLAAGATTEILVGGGASALPVWTTASGSGSPVRATSPTLTTPVVDQFGTASGLGAAWSGWTPTWTVLTIGNATQANVYKQIGKTVVFSIQVTLGSTSSMGTGKPTFTLPVTAASMVADSALGAARYNAGGVLALGEVLWNSTTTGKVVHWLANGTYVTEDQFTSGGPGTWSNGSTITATGIYQAA